MKKILSVGVILVVVLLLLSAFNPRTRGLKPGYFAPEVTLGDTTFFDETEGRYLLLNFWASYDAPSRIANIRYSDAMKAIDSTQLRYVAISYDRSAALYDEIVKRDGVNTTCQYYDPSGEGSTLYEHYRLSKGFASYLIAPDGRIVAHNPNPETLAQILGE